MGLNACPLKKQNRFGSAFFIHLSPPLVFHVEVNAAIYQLIPINHCINFAICGNGMVLAIAIISVSEQSSTVKVIRALPNGICNS